MFGWEHGGKRWKDEEIIIISWNKESVSGPNTLIFIGFI